MHVGYPFVRVINSSRYSFLKPIVAKNIKPFDEKAKEELRKLYTESTENIIQEMEEGLASFVIEGLEEDDKIRKVKLPIRLPSGYYVLKEVYGDDEKLYASLYPLSREDILDYLVRSKLASRTLEEMSTEILMREGPLDLVDIVGWILMGHPWTEKHHWVEIETCRITIPAPEKELLEVLIRVEGKVHRLITELFNVSVGVDVNRYPRMAINRHDNYSLGVVRLTVPNALIMWERTKDDIRVVGVSVRS